MRNTDDAAPTPPDSLPKYISEGIPKQDDATLEDARDWIDELLAHRDQPVTDSELPDDAEPVNEDSGSGTVVEEMVTCGDDSCECMDGGDKHGPYLYRYYREGGELKSEYIGPA